MRRKDREMDRSFAIELIDRVAFGVLSVCGETAPVSVPLSLVREGEVLYFHSATQGEKVGYLKEGSEVCVVFVGRVQVPELYSGDELDALMSDPINHHQLLSRVFTTEFESAVVKGRIFKVEDEPSKAHALRLICQKYTPEKMNYVEQAIGSGIAKTMVYGIEMDEISAKRKKFGLDGKELKFMRQD